MIKTGTVLFQYKFFRRRSFSW